MPLLRLFAMAIVKTLTKVFGLATVSLFGRIPTRDADRMAVIGLAALTWPATVVAVLVPEAAEALIPFAPDDEALLRGLAVASALVLPAAVGATVGRLHNHRDLGRRHRATEVLRGFRYTPIIAGAVLGVLIVLPPLALRRLLRGWEAGRLMIRVPGAGVETALAHIQAVLDDAGHRTERAAPPRAVVWQFHLLGYVLRDIFRLHVATDLHLLEGEDRGDGPFEVTIHSADLTILGPREQVTRIHATLAEHLDVRCLGITWDDHTIALEERIGQLRDRLEAEDPVDLEEVDALITELASSALDQESWSALRRALHRLERDVLRARLEAASSPERDPTAS